MIPVTDPLKGTSVREKAADLARQWERRAVTAMAEAFGSTTVTRPMFRGRPDLNGTVIDVEPIAGLQAATSLKRAARRLAHEYVRQAREAGNSWHDIGVLLGFGHLAESDMSVAGAAYYHAAGGLTPGHVRRPGCARCARQPYRLRAGGWEPGRPGARSRSRLPSPGSGGHRLERLLEDGGRAMTFNARRYRAPKHGRQKNWLKRRAPIARLRNSSWAKSRTHASERAEGCA